MSWKNTQAPEAEKDITAFLYNLSVGTKMAEQKNGNSIVHDPNNGPIFGSEEGYGNDILIGDGNCDPGQNMFMGNFTYVLPTDADDATYFTGTEDVKLQEIEVYSVIKS